MKFEHETYQNCISFQYYTFNTRTGMLTIKNGEEIFMEHRLRDIFMILLENKGEFLSKDELLDLAWRDTIVTEQSVVKAIYDLRRFFITNGIRDLKITTIRKLGYRLEIAERGSAKKTYNVREIAPYAFAVILLVIFLIFH
jgi:DNA-binding winged helix-turn-helix (wHTH) protein